MLSTSGLVLSLGDKDRSDHCLLLGSACALSKEGKWVGETHAIDSYSGRHGGKPPRGTRSILPGRERIQDFILSFAFYSRLKFCKGRSKSIFILQKPFLSLTALPWAR